MWIIYLLFADGRPVYVGQSTDMKRRLREHRRRFGGTPLHTALEVVATQKAADDSERFWIAEYERHGVRLLNRADGVGPGSMRPDTKAKLSAALIGRPVTWAEKISKAQKGLKRNWSEEGKARMASSQIKPGRIMAPEHEAARLKSVNEWWAKQAPDDKSAYLTRLREMRMERTTPEQRSEAGRRAYESRLASGAEERVRAAATEGTKSYFSDPEKRAKVGDRIRKMWADMTPEVKAEYLARRGKAIAEAKARKKQAA